MAFKNFVPSIHALSQNYKRAERKCRQCVLLVYSPEQSLLVCGESGQIVHAGYTYTQAVC